MNVRGLSPAISHSVSAFPAEGDNAFALVLMCRGHIRVFLCSPINWSHLSHSDFLFLSVSLRLSDYSLHPLAQLLIYRALAGTPATENQHFMSDVFSHGRPRWENQPWGDAKWQPWCIYRILLFLMFEESLSTSSRPDLSSEWSFLCRLYWIVDTLAFNMISNMIAM